MVQKWPRPHRASALGPDEGVGIAGVTAALGAGVAAAVFSERAGVVEVGAPAVPGFPPPFG